MKERCRDGCRTSLLIAGVVLVRNIFHTLLPQVLTNGMLTLAASDYRARVWAMFCSVRDLQLLLNITCSVCQ